MNKYVGSSELVPYTTAQQMNVLAAAHVACKSLNLALKWLTEIGRCLQSLFISTDEADICSLRGKTK
jgi:hypothetical protein